MSDSSEPLEEKFKENSMYEDDFKGKTEKEIMGIIFHNDHPKECKEESLKNWYDWVKNRPKGQFEEDREKWYNDKLREAIQRLEDEHNERIDKLDGKETKLKEEMLQSQKAVTDANQKLRKQEADHKEEKKSLDEIITGNEAKVNTLEGRVKELERANADEETKRKYSEGINKTLEDEKSKQRSRIKDLETKTATLEKTTVENGRLHGEVSRHQAALESLRTENEELKKKVEDYDDLKRAKDDLQNQLEQEKKGSRDGNPLGDGQTLPTDLEFRGDEYITEQRSPNRSRRSSQESAFSDKGTDNSSVAGDDGSGKEFQGLRDENERIKAQLEAWKDEATENVSASEGENPNQDEQQDTSEEVRQQEMSEPVFRHACEKLFHLRDGVKKQGAQVADLKTQLRQQRRDMLRNINNLIKEIRETQGDLSTNADESIGVFKAAYEKYKSLLEINDKLGEENKELKDAIVRLDSEIEGLQSALNDSREKAEKGEEEVRTAAHQEMHMNTLLGSVTTQTAQVNELYSQLQKAKAVLQEARQNIFNCQKENENSVLRRSAARLVGESVDWEKQAGQRTLEVEQLERNEANEIKKLRKALEIAREDNVKALNLLNGLHGIIDRQKEEADNAEKELDDANKNALDASKDKLQEELEKVKKDAEDLKDKFEKARKSNERATGLLDRIRTTVDQNTKKTEKSKKQLEDAYKKAQEELEAAKDKSEDELKKIREQAQNSREALEGVQQAGNTIQEVRNAVNEAGDRAAPGDNPDTFLGLPIPESMRYPAVFLLWVLLPFFLLSNVANAYGYSIWRRANNVSRAMYANEEGNYFCFGFPPYNILVYILSV